MGKGLVDLLNAARQKSAQANTTQPPAVELAYRMQIVEPTGVVPEEDREEGWGRVVVDFTGSGLEPK